MFVGWEDLMDILTRYSITKNFMETFTQTANNEKVTLCIQNEFIRRCLDQWLDSPEFNDSLKNSIKSNEIRMKANEEFKNNRLEFCYKLYTQAAQLALHDSFELALALSNRSAVCMKFNEFQSSLKDIDSSLTVLENPNFEKKEINHYQLITKLMKRKIECLIALNQYIKAQTCWNKLLELSKNVSNITIENQFIQKHQHLSNFSKSDSSKAVTNENFSKINQLTILNEELIKKTLEKNNIILPFKSSKLELCYTKTKGNHIIASTNIMYGELLIFENPFAFVLLPEYYDLFCYNCCVVLKYYSVPCEYCCTVLFCGKKCQQESWNSYHRWECKQGTSIFKCIGIAHLALRLTIETLYLNNKNDQVYNLLTHIDDLKPLELFQYSLTASLLLLYLQKKTNFFEEHPKLTKNSVGNELLLHMMRLVCNGNAISTHIMSDNSLKASNTLIDESQPRIGTAIFPTSSLLNHSCDPNIFSSNILKYVVIKASRDIQKGEEITNCYGPNFRRMRLIERQASLKAQYHFDCKCCVCINPYKEDSFYRIIEGLVCLLCNNDIKVTETDLDVNNTVHCHSCSKQIKSLKYKKYLLQADDTYNKGVQELEKNNVLKAIDIILESLRLYTLVLNKKNSKISKCEDSLAKCFAIVGDFKNCLKYLNKSFETIEDRYGKHSIEVAYELDKISDIMVKSLDIRQKKELIQQALAYVRRSMKIFHANLSAWDIPYNESDIVNAKYKEKMLLLLLEGDESCNVNFEDLKI